MCQQSLADDFWFFSTKILKFPQSTSSSKSFVFDLAMKARSRVLSWSRVVLVDWDTTRLNISFLLVHCTLYWSVTIKVCFQNKTWLIVHMLTPAERPALTLLPCCFFGNKRCFQHTVSIWMLTKQCRDIDKVFENAISLCECWRTLGRTGFEYLSQLRFFYK